MANRSFHLKRSCLAIVFQCGFFILFLIVLQQTLSIWLWLLSCILAFIGYFFLLKAPRPLYFEHLQAQEWSLLKTDQSVVQKVMIHHLVDHQLYIVVHFQKGQHNSLVIWRDQLPRLEWKALKKLAQLL